VEVKKTFERVYEQNRRIFNGVAEKPQISLSLYDMKIIQKFTSGSFQDPEGYLSETAFIPYP